VWRKRRGCGGHDPDPDSILEQVGLQQWHIEQQGLQQGLQQEQQEAAQAAATGAGVAGPLHGPLEYAGAVAFDRAAYPPYRPRKVRARRSRPRASSGPHPDTCARRLSRRSRPRASLPPTRAPSSSRAAARRVGEAAARRRAVRRSPTRRSCSSLARRWCRPCAAGTASLPPEPRRPRRPRRPRALATRALTAAVESWPCQACGSGAPIKCLQVLLVPRPPRCAHVQHQPLPAAKRRRSRRRSRGLRQLAYS
jgi:hypothetical protein